MHLPADGSKASFVSFPRDSYVEIPRLVRAVQLLEQTLEEEERTDKILTQLGESGINEAAAAAGVGAEDEE